MKRCMIVDDSNVIRKVAKRILSSDEMTVIEAASASEALFMCQAAMPNIIVVDESLPDMTAEQFIREAMVMAGPAKPNVVLCLAELNVGTVMRAKRAGAKGYILKPFNRPLLLDRFRALDLAA